MQMTGVDVSSRARDTIPKNDRARDEAAAGGCQILVAIAIIIEDGRKHFDPEVAGAFAAIADEKSSVSFELFSSHTARSGVGSLALHSVTCSAGRSC